MRQSRKKEVFRLVYARRASSSRKAIEGKHTFYVSNSAKYLPSRKRRQLRGDLPQRREGHAGRHAKVDSRRVEHPDLWQLNCEVGEQYESTPLFGGGRDFLLEA